MTPPSPDGRRGSRPSRVNSRPAQRDASLEGRLPRMPWRSVLTKTGRPSGLHLGLISGWAHDADYLAPLADRLSATHRVHQAAVGDWAPNFVDGLIKWVGTFPEGDVCLIGWSMGALVVLDALSSMQLSTVTCAVLLNGTARFTETEGYPFGWSATHIRAMQRGLKSRPQATLRSFFELVNGHPTNNAQNAMSQGVDVLTTGLAYLKDTDVREFLKNIQQPVLCWHGANDRVIPVGASQWLSHALPHATVAVHPQAGHDGPVAYAADVHATITTFLAEQVP